MTNLTFDYLDFNTTTRRSADTRKHGSAVAKPDIEGGFYVTGALGCGKTRPSVREALIEYLGGRELIAHRVYD